MEAITFANGPITMAGNLHLPADFDPKGSYAAVVTVHPGGGVKEQTAGLCASKMAGQGFVVLAFDASYQGDSGGEPHFLEDPSRRVEDVHAAVDSPVAKPDPCGTAPNCIRGHAARRDW